MDKFIPPIPPNQVDKKNTKEDKLRELLNRKNFLENAITNPHTLERSVFSYKQELAIINEDIRRLTEEKETK